MSTLRIPPFFRREKGSPSPCLRALLDPSCQETIPSACSDKLIPENVFFLPPLPFPPSCHNVFSIFNPQPSKLPSSLQILSDEWTFKNQLLNAWLHRFTCLSSFILQWLLKSGQSFFCMCPLRGFAANMCVRYHFVSFHSSHVCFGWTPDCLCTGIYKRNAM